MTITTQEALDPDPKPGRALQDSAWLEIGSPTTRTVFAGGDTGGCEAQLAGYGMVDRGEAPRHVPVRPIDRRKGNSRRSARSRGAGSAVACADSGGPTLHGARLTRRGRVLVAVAWMILAMIAAVPIVNAITDGAVVDSGSAPAETSVVEVAAR